MSRAASRYPTFPVEPEDAASGFRCGKRALDDYFKRHAVANDRAGIGRAYVMRRAAGDDPALPLVLGFYTLSMASVESSLVARASGEKLPRYPVPAALIGRFAIDERAQRRRLGETLLMDALRRVVDAAGVVGCLGIVVDAKDESAEAFYGRYDFVTIAGESWPRRMFLALGTARAAFAEP